MKEALASNDWEWPEVSILPDLDNFNDAENGEEADEGANDFGVDLAETAEEMAGMTKAINGGTLDTDEEDGMDADQDMEIEKLQAAMLKMQVVRGMCPPSLSRYGLTKLDMGADLPESERKRLAAKTVSEIMKTL